MNGPSLVAAGVTEVHFELITDNGGSVAVVNQFDTTGSFTGPAAKSPPVCGESRFTAPRTAQRPTPTPPRSMPAAVTSASMKPSRTATAALKSHGLDPADLIMKVTTDADLASRLQRLDLETNELVDELTDARIG